MPRVHYISTDTHFSIWTNISCNLEKSFLQFGQIHFANSLIGAIDDPCIVMGKLYFTPLLCHYGECTIYPPRCYDKQPSSLFVRYNLSFVIRFNIELRPLAFSSLLTSCNLFIASLVSTNIDNWTGQKRRKRPHFSENLS